ncbi:MAG: glycosyltransferase [Elusimicrobiales bacterium]
MNILILNFNECPENYHLEAVFSEILLKVDIPFYTIHSFNHDYSHLSEGRIKKRQHISRVSLKNLFKQGFNLLISIDFPWKRNRNYLAYIKIIKEIKCKKIIIANHLCPDPGQSAFIDDSKERGLLNLFQTLYILEYDDDKLWPAKSVIIKKRKFAVDTDYYRPINVGKKYDILCFGSKSRAFDMLQELSYKYSVAVLTSLSIKIPNLIIMKFNENLFKVRDIINSSRLVVAPVNESEINPACGNTALFLAMACGIPAVVRATNYMKRYVKDGVNSFLYKTPNDFLKKVISAFEKTEKLEVISKNARETAIEDASMKKIIKYILEEEIKC